MKNKIIFIKISTFSHINLVVYQKLQLHFPEYEIITVDAGEILKSKKKYVFLNFMTLLKEYFFRLITLRIKVRDCIIPNTYFFTLIRERLQKEFKQWSNSIAFTFQTQSLIDGSIPGIKNYILTDNTFLENHNNLHYDKNKTPTAKWLRLEKSIFMNAAKIFVMSSNVQKSLIKQYRINSNKIKVVYAGGNININNPNSELKDYSKKNILFIGGNWKRKGGSILLQAFENIQKVHKDATLTIVSWRAPKIMKPGITLYGKVGLDEISKLFHQASIFCMPSFIEPFGIVFIEAMMNKLPIVATKINAIPDFVTDNQNGFLVQPGNVDQLETALMKLLDSPVLCKKYGENGYDIYLEKYNWDEAFQKIKSTITGDLSYQEITYSKIHVN